MIRSACLFITALTAFAQHGIAQSPTSQLKTTPSQVTTTEPGVYKLSDLFTRADRVALVKVISGNTEAYDVAIYKAQVIRGFKGLSAGENIYFGPYIGTELGSEYILFLRDTAKAMEPRAKTDGGFGTIKYMEVFDEGYSSMRTSYACIFEAGAGGQKCDYGARVCTDYIKLPKSLPAFPPDSDDPPFGCRWVRKAAFISILDNLGEEMKVETTR